MGRILTRNGAEYPFWGEHMEYHAIGVADFDPTNDVTIIARDKPNYLKNGFMVKNASTNIGHIFAITFHQYEANQRQLVNWITGVALVPVRIDLDGYDWVLTPLVKVFAGNDATYPSTVMYITVGWIK